MGVIALTPVMLAAHSRAGIVVPTLLVACIAMVDVARFALDVSWVGWLNLAFVWLLAHQAGFFYAGSLLEAGPRAHASLAIAGLAGLIALTNIGTYPRSMVGTDVEVVSNMNPPTLCIAALTCWLIGAALLLRPSVNRWLQGIGPWKAVIAANSMIMTVFLWHLTAYLVTIVLLYPLGLGHPLDGTASWWLQRPIWIVAPAIVLVPLVLVFARFERAPGAGA